MFNFKKKQLPKKRAIFTVNIDLNGKYTERFGYKNNNDEHRLTSNQSYYFDQNEENVTYENIKEFSLNIIERKLQEELQELIDIPIYSITINKTYEGSIGIIFSVLFNIYQFIA